MVEDGLHWFVGHVLPHHERKVADELRERGVECFLPMQKVTRKWSDRIKHIDQLVLPRMIFVHSTEPVRNQVLREIPALRSFMSKGGPFNPVIVPDRQMKDFIYMISNAEDVVAVSQETWLPGDHVKIVAGPLKGLECELVEVQEHQCVAIRLNSIGSAYMKIEQNMIQKTTD